MKPRPKPRIVEACQNYGRYGISLAQLCREVGIDPSVMSRYVHGTQYPGVLTAIRIAQALDTTVESLWSPQ